MGRSAKEERELGTGALEKARKGLTGRRKTMQEAEDEAIYGPKKKKKKGSADEEESE